MAPQACTKAIRNVVFLAAFRSLSSCGAQRLRLVRPVDLKSGRSVGIQAMSSTDNHTVAPKWSSNGQQAEKYKQHGGFRTSAQVSTATFGGSKKVAKVNPVGTTVLDGLKV